VNNNTVKCDLFRTLVLQFTVDLQGKPVVIKSSNQQKIDLTRKVLMELKHVRMLHIAVYSNFILIIIMSVQCIALLTVSLSVFSRVCSNRENKKHLKSNWRVTR